MGFTEETFLFIFLPFTIIAYLILGQFNSLHLQNLVIIAFSVAFYAWSSLGTLALFIILCVSIYLIGYALYLVCKKGERKRLPVLISCLALLLPLCFFKYTAFIVDTINALGGYGYSFMDVLVPIGISFVTFEGISYVVDVYRGNVKPGNLFDVFLFLSFFPKITAGPIVLFRDFAPQIHNRVHSISMTAHGFQRIIIGYAEKVILADTFGAQLAYIDSLTDGGTACDTLTLWLKGILIFFQIYFDFSGYSQIAIGLSEIFGFTLKENFNFPYMSTSISEFWRRWHISLGSFFREYVYIPLGGNRTGNVYIHLFIVFLLTGIWHGANWTFIIWGIIHGIFVMLERFARDKQWYQSTPTGMKWFVTMVILFFTWILFNAETLTVAAMTYAAMFTWVQSSAVNFGWQFFLTRKIGTLLAIAGIGAVLPVFKIPESISNVQNTSFGFIFKRIVLLLLLLLDIIFVVNSTYSPFIYFQF